MSRNTVCVVEGDATVRDSVRMLLEQRGIRVACHASAMAFLKEADFDCCSCFPLDNELPELSGIELREILRARRVGTPAIIMTAGANPQLAHRAARAGAVILHKPMRVDEILTALRLAATDTEAIQEAEAPAR